MAKDPVCGIQVDEKKAVDKVDSKGRTYYFCSAACKTAFEQSPPTYAPK